MSNSNEIVPAEAFTGQRQGGELPQVGEFYWIKPEEGKSKPKLLCVQRVRSNHVEFVEEGGGYSSTELVSIYDLLARVTFEPDWKRIIEDRMHEIKLQIEAATKSLYDEAVKKGALPSAPAAEPQDRNCMLPAVRVLDPIKQKRDLVKLQKQILVVTKKIDELAKQYAGQATMLMLPELCRLRAMKTKLGVVEDQIFTLEVYAGLQEEVLQIKDGEPAGASEPIAIRQSMLYMDEETLFDYDEGGMDFRRVRDFDKWVVKPETLARVLPEKRGIVAFRIRREKKNYDCNSIWDAWSNMKENQWNMQTYLLIRNGDRCYRIASEVDFSPRLIPLRSEFDSAFKEVQRGAYDWGTRKEAPPTIRTIAPQDFDYDDEAEKLHGNLKHYNRIVVLIQGLLDRSDVFHPHVPLNLSNEAELNEWMRFIRDEEDAIGIAEETWVEYRDRLNALLVKDALVYTGWHRDLRKRSYYAEPMPKILPVVRVRAGRASDAIPPADYNRYNDRRDHYGRDEKECIGIMGVDVEWPMESRYSDDETERYCRAWIPLHEVFNVTDYRLGDYKRFAGSRTQKAEYVKWAPAFLRAEDHHAAIAKKDAEILARILKS